MTYRCPCVCSAIVCVTERTRDCKVHPLRQPRHVLADLEPADRRVDRPELPRIDAGASGFMSHMSIVAGPPVRKSMITLRAGGDAAAGGAG